MKILKNVYILYAVFLISLLNIGWFIYYNNYNSLIAFITCCLTIYLINHNMIIVLGLSMILVNTLSMFNLVKMNNQEGFEEGFEEGFKEGAFNMSAWRRQLEAYYRAIQRAQEARRQAEIDKRNRELKEIAERLAAEAEAERLKLKSISETQSYNQTKTVETFKNKGKDSNDSDDDSDDDEKTKYMEDKKIIDKIKKLDPIITDLLMNMNHGHIDTINQTLNHITGGNVVDV